HHIVRRARGPRASLLLLGDRARELAFRPVGRDELALPHDVHGNVVAGEARVIGGRVAILAVGCQQAEVLERLLNASSIRTASLFDGFEQQQAGAVTVLRELWRGVTVLLLERRG